MVTGKQQQYASTVSNYGNIHVHYHKALKSYPLTGMKQKMVSFSRHDSHMTKFHNLIGYLFIYMYILSTNVLPNVTNGKLE